MQGLDASAWQRLSAGEGTKGPRLYDWAYLELADLDASEYDCGQSGPWTRGLLIRRNLADGECAYFTTWCPAGTGIETLVAVEGQRWSIEDSFETSKNELGLDHNETRSWHGWHRHVSLVMLAFAMLATIRYHANCQPPQKPPPSMIRKQNQPSSAGQCRKSAASLHGLRSGVLSLRMSLPGRSGGAPIRPPQSALT
jgi:SRSO17 transposase